MANPTALPPGVPPTPTAPAPAPAYQPINPQMVAMMQAQMAAMNPPPKKGGAANKIANIMMFVAIFVLLVIIGIAAYKMFTQKQEQEVDEDGNVNLVLDDLQGLNVEEAIRTIEEIEARPDSDFE